MQTLIQSNIRSIIKLQSFIRRLRARKHIKEKTTMRDMYRMHARYFAREELFETLSETKELGPYRIASFNYKNAGLYEGEWLGGFRHGTGKMTWADGASYKGDWDMGYATGSGLFIDCLGNRYEGKF